MKKSREFFETGLSSSEDQLGGIILRIEALIDGLKLENVKLRERIHELEKPSISRASNVGKGFQSKVVGT